MNVTASFTGALEAAARGWNSGAAQGGALDRLVGAGAEGDGAGAVSLKAGDFAKWFFSASAPSGEEILGSGNFRSQTQSQIRGPVVDSRIEANSNADAATAPAGAAQPEIANNGPSQTLIEAAAQEESEESAGQLQSRGVPANKIADVQLASTAALPIVKKGDAQVPHAGKRERAESSAQKPGTEYQAALGAHPALEAPCAPATAVVPAFSARNSGGTEIDDSTAGEARQGPVRGTEMTEKALPGSVNRATVGTHGTGATGELRTTSGEEGTLKAETDSIKASAETEGPFASPELGTAAAIQNSADAVPNTASKTIEHYGAKGSHALAGAPSTSPTSEKSNSGGLEIGAAQRQTSEANGTMSQPTLDAGQGTAHEKIEPQHRDTADNMSAQAVHVASVQIQHGIGDAPAVVHGTANVATEHVSHFTAGSSTSGAGAETRETFAALDSQTAVETPNWIHAGGRQAEAGFQDPALGWVGVRADLSGGGVHAAVVPASAEAAQVLGTHLPGLGNYLAEQHASATVTMANPGESGLGPAMDQGQRQGSDQQQRTETPVNAQSGGVAGVSTVSSSHEVGVSGVEAIRPIGGLNGTHISVMA